MLVVHPPFSPHVLAVNDEHARCVLPTSANSTHPLVPKRVKTHASETSTGEAHISEAGASLSCVSERARTCGPKTSAQRASKSKTNSGTHGAYLSVRQMPGSVPHSSERQTVPLCTPRIAARARSALWSITCPPRTLERYAPAALPGHHDLLVAHAGDRDAHAAPLGELDERDCASAGRHSRRASRRAIHAWSVPWRGRPTAHTLLRAK